MNDLDLDIDVQWLLTQWGRWARKNPDEALGYPGEEPFSRLRGSTVPEPLIDDTQAERIDGAVALLGIDSPMEGRIVCGYYYSRWSVKAMAGALGRDRRNISTMLRSGESWIRAVLKMSAVIAERPSSLDVELIQTLAKDVG